MYVVIVDTAQIQPYIFGSNRLKENIGASYLVAQATTSWAESCLPPGVETLYAGGGNFVALAEDEPAARAFSRALSKKVLADAPDLQLVMTYRERGRGETLATAVTNTFLQLAQRKQARPQREPLLGLGVTQMCRSTALPAVGYANDPDNAYPASAAILAKLAANQSATDRLNKELQPPASFSYPRDFEDLGREKGEQSYIAVVHADGNGMGQRFLDLNKEHASNPDDEAYKQAIQKLSNDVNRAGLNALAATVQALHGRICRDEPDKKDAIRLRNVNGDMITEVLLKQENGATYLPFRPLVFGGDDVTFVCDGRLGIALAIEYLNQFEKQTGAILGETLTASAGIAIVKSRYPFARAYDLAEALCSSAKKYRAQNNLAESSCLDWHFALTGLAGDLNEIRRREYTTWQDPARLKDENYRGESLTLRPLTLNDNPKESHRSFNVVHKGVAAFQDLHLGEGEKPVWSTRRNKVKALRDALRNGPAAVQRFMIMYGLKTLPRIDAQKDSNFQFTGWSGSDCGYFDAIEMMDWYISLEAQ